MIDKETIQHIETRAAAFKETITGPDCDVLLTPNDFKLQSLEKFNDNKNRFQGIFETSDVKAFAEYFEKKNIQDSTVCFVDADNMTAKTIFDLGNNAEPLHCEHTAILKMRQTAAFSALTKINDESNSQRSAAEWLEDWRDHLTAMDQDEKLIEIKKSILAVRSLTFEEKQKTDSSEDDFRSSRSRMEEIEVNSGAGLPSRFIFTTIPYHGLGERDFLIRPSFIHSRGDVRVVFRISNIEKEQEEMANEFKDLLSETLINDAVIYIGSFKV